MKRLISLVVFGAVSALGLFAQSQSAPSFTVSSGTALASTKPCSDISNVGSIYTQYANPSVTSVCSQVAASVNGLNNGGSFAWETLSLTGLAQTITGVVTFSTAPVIATITNTGTETLPSNTGGIPIVIACGATTTTCADTATGATAQVYFGSTTLASNTRTVTISPGYTGTTSFYCIGQDTTTRANPVQVIPASATTLTITNTTGATDVISWACFGN